MSPFQSFITLNTSAPITIGCTAPLCAYPSCKCYVPLPKNVAEKPGVGTGCMSTDLQEERGMKDDFSAGPLTGLIGVAAEHRPAPKAEFRKPRRVERQATKANQMIQFLAAGNREAALALVDGEDMARRLPADQIEKVISDEAFKELSDSIGKSAADVIQPEAKLSEELTRAVDGMVAEGGPAGDTQ